METATGANKIYVQSKVSVHNQRSVLGDIYWSLRDWFLIPNWSKSLNNFRLHSTCARLRSLAFHYAVFSLLFTRCPASLQIAIPAALCRQFFNHLAALPLDPYRYSNPKCYRQISNRRGAGADAAAGQRPALCGGSFAASWFFGPFGSRPKGRRE